MLQKYNEIAIISALSSYLRQGRIRRETTSYSRKLQGTLNTNIVSYDEILVK